MKATTGLVLLPVALAMAFSQPASAQVKTGIDASASVAAVVAANNAFALDLYRQLAGQPGNLFFSPFSTETALAMTCAGARGQTAAELARVLRLSGTTADNDEGFGALTKEMGAGGTSAEKELYQLVTANALWGQEGCSFRKEFQDTARDQYGAEINQVDFKAVEPARQKINEWVAGKTDDKIQGLIQPGGLSPDTRLILANAIYFKSRWQTAFSDAFTKATPFHPAPGETVSVPMMNLQAEMDYLETDTFQMLDLPYNGHRLSMTIVLPKDAGGLSALEKTITGAQLDNMSSNGRLCTVKVSLPKFTFASAFSLGDTLKAMGAACAFSPACADFSGMLSGSPIFIGAVIHKAYVAVDEEGTEASAATAVEMLAGAMRLEPQEPVIFRADHPFLFLIRENQTGAILFFGRVTNPAQ
jgi:serpin B